MPAPGWETLTTSSAPLFICVAQPQTQHLAHSRVSAMILEFKTRADGRASVSGMGVGGSPSGSG